MSDQPSLLEIAEPENYTEKVAHLFRCRPGVWIDGLHVAQIGGAYAWRTRLSECRTQLGMDVRNRQRKVGQRTVSEYAYFPK
jgi:hypothetical protein